MPTLDTILIGVGLPAGVCAILLLPAILMQRRRPHRRYAALFAALALGLAYLCGHIGLVGWPKLPPKDATQWLIYLTVAAMIVGLTDAVARRASARWVVRAAFLTFALWALLRPMVRYSWTHWEAALWILGLAATGLAFWAATAGLADRSSARLWSATSLSVAAGSAAVLTLSGTALIGQLAGSLSAALGTVCVAALAWPRLPAHGGAAVLVTLLTGFWINGYFYAEAPALSIGLLIITPPLVLLAHLGPLRDAASWKAVAVRLLAALGPPAAAVVVAYQASPPIDY